MTIPNDHIASPRLEESQYFSADWRNRLTGYLEPSTLLRILGGASTILAIVLFLFQRWEDGSDTYRYSLLLGETILLTLLGFSTNRWLNEPKSARLFLSLSLVSTTAVFTILAAMIHTQFNGIPVGIDYPDFAVWTAHSRDTLLYLLAGSLLLSGLLCHIGFSILARPLAGRLTLVMLLNIAVLLLPIREFGTTMLIWLPAGLISYRLLSGFRVKHLAMKTLEGQAAAVLVISPLLVTLVRSAYFYAEESVAILSIAVIVYITLRQLSLTLAARPALRHLLEKASLLPALLAAFALCDLTNTAWAWPVQGNAVLFAAITVAALWDLHLRTAQESNLYLNAIGYTMLALGIVEMVAWPGVFSATLALTLSSATAVLSYGTSEITQLRLSLITMLCALALLSSEIIGSIHLGSWMGLSLLGILTIVSAAAIERHGNKFRSFIRKLQSN